jgi:hypothetical protein
MLEARDATLFPEDFTISPSTTITGLSVNIIRALCIRVVDAVASIGDICR